MDKSFPLPFFAILEWNEPKFKILYKSFVYILYTKIMINLMTQGCFIILYLQFYNHSILSSIQLRYVLIVILIFTGKNNYWFFGLLSLKLNEDVCIGTVTAWVSVRAVYGLVWLVDDGNQVISSRFCLIYTAAIESWLH